MSWLTDEELEDCFDSIGAVTARVSSPRSTYRSGAIAAPRVYSGGATRSLGSVAMPNAPKVMTLAPGKITPVQYPGSTVNLDVPGPGVNPVVPAITTPATPVATPITPTTQPDNSYPSYQPDFSDSGQDQGPDAIDQYLADEAYDEDAEFDEASDFGD